MIAAMATPHDLQDNKPRADPVPQAVRPSSPARATDRAFSHDCPPIACIVGAPRCGTTTFARWLRRRPEVCFSKIKEPHFFTLVDSTGVPDSELPKFLEDRYLNRYFAHRMADTQLLAEGSISYLYAPEQLRPLLRMWPDARFIIALRDPFELLPSVHQRLLFQGDETVMDFTAAWRLQEARAHGRHIPASCVDARQLQYLEVARLGKHVAHFFEVVGRDKCHVVLFDDLRSKPAATYLELLHFLGIEDDGFRDFSVNRPSRGFRFGWLQRLLKRPTKFTRGALASPSFQYRFASAVDKQDSRARRTIKQVRKKLLKWNEKDAVKQNLPTVLRDEVRLLLREDVEALARLIGRDLDHWLGGKPAAASPKAKQSA